MDELWEYTVLSDGAWTAGPVVLLAKLNEMGSIGWEAVGYTMTAPSNMTMGNMSVLMKRRRAGFDPPEDVSAGWRDDPSGRNVLRWWDGIRWTEAVSDRTSHAVDFPTSRH